MNYGGEFDKRFAGVAAARDLARNKGRRTTVTAGLIDPTKLKTIQGFDATILEEKSGECGSSSGGQGPLSSSNQRLGSIQDAISAGHEMEGDENDYDF